MYSRVYVEITNVCNKSCSFCPGHRRTAKMMSLCEFEHVLKQLDGVTDYIYYHLMGEPLLHSELPTFIGLASQYAKKSAITTNGTCLSRVGDELIRAGVYKVNISLHSFEGESSDEYIEYLGQCFDFADKASRAGVLVVFRLWNSGCDGGRNDDILARMKERFFDGEWKFSARGARIRNKLHLEYGERFLWPDMEADVVSESVYCYGLGDHFAILCDGSVVPCCLDRNGDITLGNVFEEQLCDILTSDTARNIREGFKNRRPVSELCKKCGYATRFNK